MAEAPGDSASTMPLRLADVNQRGGKAQSCDHRQVQPRSAAAARPRAVPHVAQQYCVTSSCMSMLKSVALLIEASTYSEPSTARRGAWPALGRRVPGSWVRKDGSWF